MKRMRQRILALALAVIFCLSFLPAAAGAEMHIYGNDVFPELSVTPALPLSNGVLTTGVMTGTVRFRDNSALSDVEHYTTVTTAGGLTRPIIEGDTRPRAGTSGTDEPTGWAFLPGADGWCWYNFQTPILGTADRETILNTFQGFLNHKYTGEGPAVYPEDVLNCINNVLDKVSINGTGPAHVSFENDQLEQMWNVANQAIDRVHETGNVEAGALTEEEKKTVTDAVTGAMGVGWAPAAGAAEGDTISVSLEALVNLAEGGYTASDMTDPIEFEVAVENDGKTFTLRPVDDKTVAVPTGQTLTYNGQEQQGVAEGTGYTLAWHKGTNAGSYQATATLLNGYTWKDGSTGAKTIDWKIDPAAITGVTLEPDTFEYNGKVQKPTAVTVKSGDLTLGEGDYQLTWSDAESKDPETYTVTAAAAGANYSGSAEATYQITDCAHDWEWTTDFASHKGTCKKCGAVYEEEYHKIINVTITREANCTRGATVEYDCSVCGAHYSHTASDMGIDLAPFLEPYGALGHDFTGPVTYIGKEVVSDESEGSHAVTCSRCGIHDYANEQPHAFATHTVSNGSCDNPDDPVIIEGTCSCGAELYKTYPREHVLVPDTSKDKQPTCTEEGKINGYRCTICGEFMNYEIKPALDHNWVEDAREKAVCGKDGFVHSTCSRCGIDKTDVLAMPSAEHNWVLNTTTEATCETPGFYNGEICTHCQETRAGDVGYGIINSLGHKGVAHIEPLGSTNKISKSGTLMDVDYYKSTEICSRCNKELNVQYYKIFSSSRLNKYEIVRGKYATITDLSNGIHIDGNMAKDGGLYFREQLKDALKKLVEADSESTNDYLKRKANSFIIEFSDEFLGSLEDGTYDMLLINGEEAWPMKVTITNHLITALDDMDKPNLPRMSEAELDALVGDAEVAEAYVVMDDEPDPVEAFVIRLYDVCLNRLPDAAGLANWTAQLKAGQITGVKAAQGFVFSQEFQNRNFCNRHFVEQLYRAFMGREYDEGGRAYWINKLETGSTREAVFNGFALSPEFTNLCNEYGINRGGGIGVGRWGTVPKGTCTMEENDAVCGEEDGVTAFVKRLYNIALVRDAEPAGLADWTGQLWAHTNTGKGVARGFIFSAEFTNRHLSNEQFVDCMYHTFFDRDGDAAGTADWVGQLNRGTSRMTVFNGFANSREFSNLCLKFGILAS